jgi:two-component system sensor histidine kinase RegB
MNHLFKFRVLLIISQLLLLLINSKWSIWPDVSNDLLLICFGYLLFVIVLQWHDGQHQQQPFMVVVDLMLWAVFFAFLDGVSNPLIWCLLIPTVLAALSQSTAFTWLMTLCSNMVYLWLWYMGNNPTEHHLHNSIMANHVLGMWLGFIVVSLLLTWVTTTLMNRIKAKNQSLLKFEQQRQADENIIKMATLATSLAHELGTPLASITLLVNELRHAEQSAGTSKDFALLESQVNRCKKVLAELTAVADRNRSDEMEIVNVQTYIEQLLMSSANELTYQIDNQLTGGIQILVDDLFKLACLNIINNSKSAGAKKIVVIFLLEQDYVVILFKDEGEGIKHKNHEGLGIGLKLSARIIEAMGGELLFKANETGAETVVKMPIYLDKSS